jgi:2-oxoglutarate ferredoxin oxidoreductase subunit alpha
VPGNRHPASAYFLRGTGHDEYARYSEEPQVWERMINRLKKKYETARQYLPLPQIEEHGNRIGIVAYGSSEPAVREARHLLQVEHQLATDFLRLRAIPFHQEVGEFIARHEVVYVVDVNRDGQMKQLLSVEYPELAARLRSIACVDGLPPTARWIVDSLIEQEVKHESTIAR